MEWVETKIWLIPLMPLLGFIFHLSVGNRAGKRVVGLVGSGVVFISFLVSVACMARLLALPADEREFVCSLITWFKVGPLTVDWAFRIDPLSAVMILVVTGVGFLIHVYSVGYMHGDKRFARYFAYLNLFTFAMLLLVLGSNLFVMFIGWEGVGLCSYLLIGFWFEDINNAAAGMKAFLVNRIGDFSFIVGMFILIYGLGKHGVWTVDFVQINLSAPLLGPGLATIVALLFFGGAVGKSAQIPLYVWLPDAMAGPTPVSALIHAATMVTAGVYMIARLSGLYSVGTGALTVVATVGAVTALFSATIALTQNDIKKVLAYSTVSQLGYMFLAVGVGAYAAGIFHLVTHSFFKACLFLGSGAVIHALAGEQDMRKMGALYKPMKITAITFIISMFAIAGFPGTSGFFSKDEILWMAFSSEQGHPALWFIGAITAGLTALYMTRLVIMMFFGESRVEPEKAPHVHEAPRTMTIPLIILAGLALVGGFLGVPKVLGGSMRFEHFLEPAIYAVEGGHGAHGSHGLELGLMGLSVLIALAGIGAGWLLYMKRPEMPGKVMERFPGLHKLVYNKYYVDEIYQAVVVNNLLRVSRLLAKFDLKVIDGAVDGSSRLTILTSKISGWIDDTFVDGAVNLVGDVILGAGERIRTIQTGRVQHYLITALGVAVLAVAARMLI